MSEHAELLRAMKAYEAARNLKLDQTQTVVRTNQVIAFCYMIFGCLCVVAGVVSMFAMLTRVSPFETLAFFGCWVFAWVLGLGCFVMGVHHENIRD